MMARIVIRNHRRQRRHLAPGSFARANFLAAWRLVVLRWPLRRNYFRR